MDRRRAVVGIVGLGGLGVLSKAIAQRDKVWRLGVLSIRARPVSIENDFQYGPFFKALRELGYVEGKNLVVEFRFAHGQYELLPALADELVRLKCDAIAVVNVPVVRAAQKATKTIPLVMLTSSDPVRDGLVVSLARPGGNTTGNSNMSADLSAKYVELAGTLFPKASTIGFLRNPANPAHEPAFKRMQAAAAKNGIRAVDIEAASAPQVEAGFSRAAKERVAAVFVGLDSHFLELRQQIVDAALKYRVPTICPNATYVVAGGLLSYGYDQADAFRHAATYVDRIFKGAKPADLPIEAPTTLRMTINLKTAKALGVTMPKEFLFRVDQVIE